MNLEQLIKLVALFGGIVRRGPGNTFRIELPGYTGIGAAKASDAGKYSSDLAGASNEVLAHLSDLASVDTDTLVSWALSALGPTPAGGPTPLLQADQAFIDKVAREGFQAKFQPDGTYALYDKDGKLVAGSGIVSPSTWDEWLRNYKIAQQQKAGAAKTEAEKKAAEEKAKGEAERKAKEEKAKADLQFSEGAPPPWWTDYTGDTTGRMWDALWVPRENQFGEVLLDNNGNPIEEFDFGSFYTIYSDYLTGKDATPEGMNPQNKPDWWPSEDTNNAIWNSLWAWDTTTKTWLMDPVLFHQFQSIYDPAMQDKGRLEDQMAAAFAAGDMKTAQAIWDFLHQLPEEQRRILSLDEQYAKAVAEGRDASAILDAIKQEVAAAQPVQAPRSIEEHIAQLLNQGKKFSDPEVQAYVRMGKEMTDYQAAQLRLDAERLGLEQDIFGLSAKTIDSQINDAISKGDFAKAKELFNFQNQITSFQQAQLDISKDELELRAKELGMEGEFRQAELELAQRKQAIDLAQSSGDYLTYLALRSPGGVEGFLEQQGFQGAIPKAAGRFQGEQGSQGFLRPGVFGQAQQPSQGFQGFQDLSQAKGFGVEAARRGKAISFQMQGLAEQIRRGEEALGQNQATPSGLGFGFPAGFTVPDTTGMTSDAAKQAILNSLKSQIDAKRGQYDALQEQLTQLGQAGKLTGEVQESLGQQVQPFAQALLTDLEKQANLKASQAFSLVTPGFQGETDELIFTPQGSAALQQANAMLAFVKQAKANPALLGDIPAYLGFAPTTTFAGPSFQSQPPAGALGTPVTPDTSSIFTPPVKTIANVAGKQFPSAQQFAKLTPIQQSMFTTPYKLAGFPEEDVVAEFASLQPSYQVPQGFGFSFAPKKRKVFA